MISGLRLNKVEGQVGQQRASDAVDANEPHNHLDKLNSDPYDQICEQNADHGLE